jgi:hypothetical protein
MFRA